MTIPPLPADLSLRASPATDAPTVVARTNELLATHLRSVWSHTDRLFAHLLMFEWLAAIILTSVRSPRTWRGTTSLIHPHVWAALLLGAAIVSLPIGLAAFRPGERLTRYAIAVGQMLVSALLIHLGDGRVEMHFHIFGSLAFLAFYRDWRVIATASAVVVLDHATLGYLIPESIYGVASESLWRTLEHAGWVAFEDLFLVVGCVRGVREMRGIARNRALLEDSLDDVEAQVQARTGELKDAQESLVKAARSAGMAEIATSVLHNVGNALNSVNISATLLGDRIRQSEVASLAQVGELFVEHQPDLAAFLTSDDRGRLVPGFIAELAACLQQEHDDALVELANLSRGVDHIKQIVAAQQSMARRSTIRTRVDPRKVMDAAVAMLNAGQRNGIEFVKHYGDDVDAVELDEHKVLQILLNLVTNACQASVARPGRARRVTLGVERVLTTTTTTTAAAAASGERLSLTVADNGVGIAPEHLARMFTHGFTTKRDGHGFGLHGAANTAREMNGAIRVASDGLNQGATFTLELPIAPAAPSQTPSQTPSQKPSQTPSQTQETAHAA